MRTLDTLCWRLLAALHFLIGATAIAGGGALVVWSNGRVLQMTVTVLDHSPFTDFLLPGVILYGAVGVHNLLAAYLVAKREPGAELLSFCAGSALLIWIVVEAAMVNASHWLQPVYGGLALVVLLGALWLRRRVAAGTVQGRRGAAHPGLLIERS